MPKPDSKAEEHLVELVIVTGLSGSGKATVLRCLEDLGYRAVDNLPIDLIETFADLSVQARDARETALGIDVREGASLERFPQVLERIRDKIRVRLVFLEAEDSVLMRRYSETRRPHPLGKAHSLASHLKEERRRLIPIRSFADLTIDTSKLTAHELRQLIEEKFAPGRKDSRLAISVISFGFRHGLPQDADLVFDVRFLPNPNYVPTLREKTGRDVQVAKFVEGYPQTVEFLDRVSSLLLYLIPHYVTEGKNYLTIAFGCTGGHHRSVFIADRIRDRLEKAGYPARGADRDLHREY
jgi:UPF0042 nucleotide-binding protein